MQMTLIAGDIGATTTRLALISAQTGPRHFIAEQEFHTADDKGLQPVVEAFCAKGRFADLLRAMPVHVVTVNAALLGAAIYGLERDAGHGALQRRPKTLSSSR
jgi:glucokinase